MKLKLLIYIVLATVLGVIFSCSRSRNDRRQGDMDIFLLDLSASLGDNPEEVNRTIDSLLQTTSDSFLYYRCLLLKSKSAFYGGNLDSSMLMLGQVEVFCNKWLEDRRVHGMGIREILSLRAGIRKYSDYAGYLPESGRCVCT